MCIEQDLVIPTMGIVFPSGSSNGTTDCLTITIVNDDVREEVQNIPLTLNTTDQQVLLSSTSTTSIVIMDNDSMF